MCEERALEQEQRDGREDGDGPREHAALGPRRGRGRGRQTLGCGLRCQAAPPRARLGVRFRVRPRCPGVVGPLEDQAPTHHRLAHPVVAALGPQRGVPRHEQALPAAARDPLPRFAEGLPQRQLGLAHGDEAVHALEVLQRLPRGARPRRQRLQLRRRGHVRLQHARAQIQLEPGRALPHAVEAVVLRAPGGAPRQALARLAVRGRARTGSKARSGRAELALGGPRVLHVARLARRHAVALPAPVRPRRPAVLYVQFSPWPPSIICFVTT